MIHIRQRSDVDCGVACLAMVCGVSYEEAAAMARRMLCALLEAELGAFSLHSDGAVWVEREPREEVAHA